jgi:tRNA pseudouridine38-40 synthase
VGLRNLKLTIAYDGTDFHGWQRQPNARTIQAELEAAAARLNGGEPVTIHGSGRTDAGVHAWGQVANWFYDGIYPCERIQAAVNSLLPPAIRVRRLEEAEAGFHARKSARAKTYLYVIDNSLYANPLLRRWAWHIRQPLDLAALQAAAGRLEGEHDFLSFKAADGETATSRRTIYQVRWRRRGHCLLFFIRGSGFLKNMVRIIVGTLVDFGRGKLAPAEMAAIISAGDRSAAGITAPAQGLTLRSVEYRDVKPSFSGRKTAPD